MSASFDASKMYTYLKGYAMGLGWNDTLAALSFARVAHKDQRRKSGEPYIVHPLTVASHAAALGVKEDAVIAAAILHDVVEDCGIGTESLPVSDSTKDAVRRLTHVKGEPLGPYYREVGESRVPDAVLLRHRGRHIGEFRPGPGQGRRPERHCQSRRGFCCHRHSPD